MLLKKLTAFIIISSVAVILSITAFSYNFLESIENKSWDFRLNLTAHGKVEADPKIKIIIVDQGSLDLYANEQEITWPWPRTLYIPVLRYLEAAGARGVAFDIIFSEGSIHGVEEDQEFAEALSGKLPVVSTVAPAVNTDKVSMNSKDFALFKKRQLESNQTSSFAAKYLADENTFRFSSATLPVPEILEKSNAFGSAWAAPDKDGIFRHYWPGGYIQDVPILSLAFALYNTASDSKKIDNFESFLDPQGRLTVRFHGGQQTYETIPIADVISSYVSQFESEDEVKSPPAVSLETFKDAWVFIGVWAPGLLDLRPAPLDEVYKGVEYHATVLDNLLHGDFVRKVPPFLNTLYCALFILLIAATAFFIKKSYSKICCYLLILSAFFYSGYLLTVYGYWILMVIPLLAITSTLIASLAYQYYVEGRERRFIKNAFGHYVSPKLIQKIIDNPDSLALGGEKKELTIFFSDLAGFTTISESLPADQLVSLLNRYLGAMTDIILDSGATLDKYEGDAIIAFWNSPVTIEDHPYCAVKAALDCQAKLEELREPFKKEFGIDLKMRIGLHTGVVNVGNFGSKDRFDYTVIGDAANLAARLEGVNKVFGTETLISESTQRRLGDRISCRRLGAIKVVGKNEAINVFEPLLAGSDPKKREIFDLALTKYEQGSIDDALSSFKEISDDPASASYIARIEEERGKHSAGWSAVWNLTSK